MAYDLTALIAKVRRITGMPSSTKLTDTDITQFINNYYLNQLPNEVILAKLKDWYTFNTTASTSEYSLDSDIRILYPPATIAGTSIGFFTDPELFYTKHPQDSGASNAKPTDVLYYGDTVILQPTPDDAYEFKCPCIKTPTALSASTDTLEDNQWFNLVAYGAAMDIQLEWGNYNEANALFPIIQYYTQLAMGLFPKPDFQKMADNPKVPVEERTPPEIPQSILPNTMPKG